MQIGAIRKEVVEILNNQFSNAENGIYFEPENTKKKTNNGTKLSAQDKLRSINWSARSEGDHSLLVFCVGMTMKSFLEEYKRKNIMSLKSRKDNIIYLYSNTPSLRTTGYVDSYDHKNTEISMYLSVLDKVITTKVENKTPKWLLNYKMGEINVFKCTIYTYWQMFGDGKTYDFSNLWKSFKFSHSLAYEEL